MDLTGLSKSNVSFHGSVYQVKLTCQTLLHGVKNFSDFYIVPELDEADIFDDIVILTNKVGFEWKTVRFIQAKHNQNGEEKISYSSMASKKSDVSLQKYYSTYLKIKYNPKFENCNLEKFVLCTNRLPDDNRVMSYGKLSLQPAMDEWINGITIEQYQVKMDVKCNLRKTLEALTVVPEKTLSQNEKEALVQEFLNKFIFAVTPLHKNITPIIMKSLKTNCGFPEDEIIASYFFTTTFDVIQKKELEGWCKEDIQKFIQDFKNTLNSWSLSDVMFFYVQGLINTEISFKTNLSCLESFIPDYVETKDLLSHNEFLFLFINFDDNNENQILHITSSSHQLTACKIYQSLKAYLNDSGDKQRILFGPLSSLLLCERKLNNISDCVTTAFDTYIDVLIIAEDIKNYSDSFTDKLWAILKAKRNKKLVILSETSSSLVEELMDRERNYFEKRFEHVTDTLNFFQLSTETQKILLKKKVTFQGQEMTLCELIHGTQMVSSSFFSDTKILEMLISGTNLFEISQICDSFTYWEESCYVERDIMVKEIRPKALLDNDNIFLVAGPSAKETEKFLKTKKVFCQNFVCLKENDYGAFILDSEESDTQYLEIIEKAELSAIFYVKLFKEHLFLYTCNNLGHTKVDSLVKKGLVKSTYISESEWFNLYLTNRSIVIADEAGNGKSTFCSRILKSLCITDPYAWKLRINLIQHIDSLQTFDFNGNDKLFRIIKFLSNYDNMSKLERILFEHKFRENNMVIIFDGYDEICPNYGKLVSSVVRHLIDFTKIKIIVTSRPDTTEKLENICWALAHNLGDLSLEKQVEFLFKFWRNRGNYSGKYERVKTYADRLLENLNRIIYVDKPIGCNPLYLKLIAELFTEECFTYVINNGAMGVTNLVQNILDLYNQFVKKIIEKRFFQEKQSMCSTPYMEDQKKILFRKEIKVHQLLALKILDEETYGLLENEDFDSSSSVLFNEIERFGIARFNNGNPIFLHFTFAEYFAASYLVEQLISRPERVDNFLTIIDKILAQDVRVFRKCLNILLEQNQTTLKDGLPGKSFINLSAKNGLLQCIFYFNDKFDFPDRDENGKSPLDYAVERGDVKIISVILVLINKINTTYPEEIKRSITYNSAENKFCFGSLLKLERIVAMPPMIYENIAEWEFILNGIKMNFHIHFLNECRLKWEFILNGIKMNFHIKKQHPSYLTITAPQSQNNVTGIIKIIQGPDYELTLLQAINEFYETIIFQNVKYFLCYAIPDNFELLNPNDEIKLKKLADNDIDEFMETISNEQYKPELPAWMMSSLPFLCKLFEEQEQLFKALTIVFVRYPKTTDYLTQEDQINDKKNSLLEWHRN